MAVPRSRGLMFRFIGCMAVFAVSIMIIASLRTWKRLNSMEGYPSNAEPFPKSGGMGGQLQALRINHEKATHRVSSGSSTSSIGLSQESSSSARQLAISSQEAVPAVKSVGSSESEPASAFKPWDVYNRAKQHAERDKLVMMLASDANIASFKEKSNCLPPPAGHDSWPSTVCIKPAYIGTTIPHAGEVTAAVHLTSERFDRVLSTTSQWGGPVVAVVFVFSDELHKVEDIVKSLNSMLAGGKQAHTDNLDVYIAIDVRGGSGSYPVNILRNAAVMGASTRRVVCLDADFMPSLDAAKKLSKLPESTENGQPIAYILPTFEENIDPVLPLPSDKSNLLVSLKIEDVLPMLRNHRSQYFTRLDKWWKAEEPYSVLYGVFYEPYVVLTRGRDDPLFDERFTGLGNDKLSLHMELHAAGYTFRVCPHDFVIHRRHEYAGGWRHGMTWDEAFAKLRDFLVYLQTKYKYDLPAPEDIAKENAAPPLGNWVPPKLADSVVRESTREVEMHPPPGELDFVTLSSDVISMVAAAGGESASPGVHKSIRGRSCDTTCVSLGLKCNAALLKEVNNCDALRQHFQCQGCEENMGHDQPAYPLGGTRKHVCLVNRWEPTCTGGHVDTIRLCKCV